jgi:hypothetical protein
MSALLWLAAAFMSAVSGEGGGGRLLALVLAGVPPFLAGAWAGSHPEIRDWPVIRLVALWFFPICGLVGASDSLSAEWQFVAMIVLAPVAILTVRWFELRGGRSSRAVSLPPALPETPIPATTPGKGTPIA